MKELRSTVNAAFLFALFLLVYAGVSPGHARGSSHAPRFLRMSVEDLKHEHDKRLTISVPYFFIGNALRVAALGRIHRELDVHFNDEIESDELASIWAELKTAPDGKDVVREHDHETTKFRKEAGMIVLECEPKDGFSDGRVKVRFPQRLLEAAVRDGKDFDVDALLGELRAAKVGDLVEVDAPDAHVKVWIE